MMTEKPAPFVLPERNEAFDLTSFECPRCAKPTSGEAYGPCPSCVGELRATQRSEASGAEAAAYEPKMNVTPNAVASKE